MSLRTPTPRTIALERPGNAGYLQPQFAAVFLGVSKSTLNKWRMKGLGPPYSKLGTKVVAYKIEELQRFADERFHSSTSEYPTREVKKKRL